MTDAHLDAGSRGSTGCRCLLCGSEDVFTFLEIPQVRSMYHIAVRNQMDAREQARGQITLAHCGSCDHVFNRTFDPRPIDYHAGYDNALHHSPRFTAYMNALATELTDRFDVRGGTVIEVGCGQGLFLRLLCDTGPNAGIGFDPSYVPDDAISAHPRLRILATDYDPSFNGRGDFVCARHVLEHTHAPIAFMFRLVALTTQQDGRILIEVPNGLHIWRDHSIWDILYEHVSHFSPKSIRHLFERCRLQPMLVEERFGDQFIVAVGRRRGTGTSSTDAHSSIAPLSSRQMVQSFGAAYRTTITTWRAWLRTAASRNKRVYLWGAGTKAISFLNFVAGQDKVLAAAIAGVVDINPGKAGRFTPGTGHPIVAPAILAERHPDIVLVMNPMYRAEIWQMLGEILGKGREKLEIWPVADAVCSPAPSRS